MINLEMKNFNMILTEDQSNYQDYHQVKLINMKKKYYFVIKAG